MTTHIKWPSIESFHHVRKHVVSYPELAGGSSKIAYKAKVKQHGTNCAIQIYSDQIVCQSRNQIISPANDNAGAATWFEVQKDLWLSKHAVMGNVIVFGEFIGNGICKGTITQSIPKRSFAIFGARRLDQPDDLIVDPEILQSFAEGLSDTYVLPWDNFEITIDWLAPFEEISPLADRINEKVARVEKCDPWIKEVFGLEGVGEGLVFYPVNRLGWEHFSNLGFKAKGEEHRVLACVKAAQVDVPSATELDEFVNLVLVEARLEQGYTEVIKDQEPTMKLMGDFLGWINRDIQKECQAELEASKLEWKFVSKTISGRAKNWFVRKMNQ